MTQTASLIRAEAAAEHFARISTRLRACRFDYTDIENVVLLYSIPAGDGWVHVIGDPNDGSYEWVYCDDGVRHFRTLRHSNHGYGGCAVAMREALIVEEPAP